MAHAFHTGLVDAAWVTLGALPPGVVAYSIAVVFTGYVVLGVSGFGSALTIVPLLALQWPLTTVVPLVLLLDVPSALLLARLNLERVAWAELRALLPGLIAGTVAGTLLARWMMHGWALALLGLYVLVVAVRGWTGKTVPRARTGRGAPVFGFAAGAVESVFGTAGPLIVAWLGRRQPDPAVLRASVPACLAAATTSALLGMAFSGQLAQAVIWSALLPLAMVAFAGTRVGHQIACRLPARTLQRAIYALLACTGGAMLLRALA
ncbi:MAG: sulfite exporter TauE/SafE family protein [Variovorax sp.]|nr:sulfite exporter TauE/SafE family protein [Variovorax sp.]